MRLLLVIVAALSLSVFAIGCGGNACQDACEKVKTCAKNMNCAGNAGCELTKGLMSSVDCKGSGSGDCSGQAKTSADVINGCNLNPKTCTCQ